MGEVIKNELHRFGQVFLSYGKIVLGGMLFASLVSFFYAGIRADKAVVELLVALAIAVTFSLVPVALLYVFRNKRELEHQVEVMKVHLELLKTLQDLETTKEKKQETDEALAGYLRQFDKKSLRQTHLRRERLWSQRQSKWMHIKKRVKAFAEPGRSVETKITRKIILMLLEEEDVKSDRFQFLVRRLMERGINLPEGEFSSFEKPGIAAKRGSTMVKEH